MPNGGSNRSRKRHNDKTKVTAKINELVSASCAPLSATAISWVDQDALLAEETLDDF